jgi:hypothetical protein
MAVCAAALVSAAHAIPEGPAPNTPEWAQRESANYAKTSEAPNEQGAPAFQQGLQTQNVTNQQTWLGRIAGDSSWLGGTSGNTEVTPVCTSWMQQCAGDPFRYPNVTGPDGSAFYQTEAEVVPFVIYDQDCARLNGRVWSPKGAGQGGTPLLPGIVLETGSIQAPEPLYWWMAQALVRQGYVVLTFDVRGQGRSDQQSPAGKQGSNADSTVFWFNLVNTIDFFRSNPVAPYPHNVTCKASYPTQTTAFNPFHARIDSQRLGIVGHSLGATGVSVVQSYGATGAEKWPGKLDMENPVDVIVAWDSLRAPGPASGGAPAVVARVPAMGQTSEYGIGGTAKQQPPDIEGHKGGYRGWKAANVPVYQFTIQGSTHFEWSLIPTFPSTSWCPTVQGGRCVGGYGRPMAEYYAVAWLDRWLKKPGEKGFDDADARLLNDTGPQGKAKLSFYSKSARAFPSRDGLFQLCEDIRAGCPAAVAVSTPVPTPATTPSPNPTPDPTPDPAPAPVSVSVPAPPQASNMGRFGGGSFDGLGLIWLALFAAFRQQRFALRLPRL